MIELRGLVKRYGSLTAVDHVDLRVPAGEILGFLGPNGAGKTTTIKMMTGILKPTAGTVVLGGRDIVRESVAAKRVFGFVPDRPYLYERLTGEELLDFVGRLYAMREEHARQRAGRLLRLFELEDRKDEPVGSYSHGMKQRLAMASALLHEPRVLIIDEPMVGLDPKAARLVKRIFRELARDGVAVFLSTHSLEVAEETCHRIAIILHGRILVTGTLEELARSAGSGGSGRLESIFLHLTGGTVTEVGEFFREPAAGAAPRPDPA